ncbi:MAG: hypothetical protein AAFY64_01195, partial [Pseudomonadota bacterium]
MSIASLQPNQAIFGEISAVNETDSYNVYLVAGQTYTFVMHAVGTDSVSDSMLRLFSPFGLVISSNDDHGPNTLNSMITIRASNTGTYRLEATAFGSNTGDYMVSMANGSRNYTPDASVQQLADFLSHTYWQAEGGDAAGWLPGSTLTYSVSGLSAPRRALAEAALDAWEEITSLTFTRVSSGGNIVFDDAESGAFARFQTRNGTMTAAEVNIAQNWDGGRNSLDS